jgi:hypothetical protein
MKFQTFEDAYPGSPAFQGLPRLRMPSGWTIGWNALDASMETDLSGIGGSSVFNATNKGRRFNIDIMFRPEFDPAGSFHLIVIYQPWPRTERGRRRNGVPFAFDDTAEEVHRFETRSYAELLEHLEHWIARCTVWTREGN